MSRTTARKALILSRHIHYVVWVPGRGFRTVTGLWEMWNGRLVKVEYCSRRDRDVRQGPFTVDGKAI